MAGTASMLKDNCLLQSLMAGWVLVLAGNQLPIFENCGKLSYM